MYMNTVCPNCVENEGTFISLKYPGVWGIRDKLSWNRLWLSKLNFYFQLYGKWRDLDNKVQFCIMLWLTQLLVYRLYRY